MLLATHPHDLAGSKNAKCLEDSRYKGLKIGESIAARADGYNTKRHTGQVLLIHEILVDGDERLELAS